MSVVVPARDAAATIGRQLECLARQDYDSPWEVIVSDNGSRDATVDVARRFADRLPGLTVVDASGRPGASHARNVAVRAARGDFLAFSDADDEADPHWLTALTRASSGAELVGGVVEETALNGIPTSARRTPSVIADRLPTVLDFLPYAVGTNCGVWADALVDAGGWNEDYPRANDVELAWRLQTRGHRIGFAPDAIVHYRHRASLRALFTQFHGWGRADARLFRDFGPAGLRRRSLRTTARNWAWLVKHAPDLLRTGTARTGWYIETARLTGRVRGSFECGVLFL